MKIKRLEIQGFKSFVDKIDMSFPEGIITVVGPNGCGKSNVVDAIRWAMGEQSAKHLRGKLMEDIIFNGSETRKPVGMAEVSLTFDNGDGRGPAEFADYGEITVSRRLFRSGESEYMINKLPCRLKDITELFMDTGVGTKAYSIVEQGKIGAIVTMKPEERRTLIEEAAGITKYKSRKTAAMRKVEATQQNLLRVKDVIREVKRQINSLERQAKKARKYKELREEVRQLEISIAALKYGNMQGTLEGEKNQLKECIDSEAAITASIAEKDKRLEEKRFEVTSAEEALRKEQDLAYKTSNRIVEFEQKIAYNEKETERLGEEETRYNKEVERLKSRLVELTAKMKSLSTELEGISENEAKESEKLKVSEEVFERLSAEFAEKERGLEKAKGEIVHIVTMKSNLGNSIIHLKERIGDLENRLKRKRAEGEEAGKALSEAEKRFNDFESKLKSLYSEKSSIGGDLSSEIERLSLLRQKGDSMEEEIKALQEQVHRTESKLYSMKELKNKYEGLQAGVQSVMERHTHAPLTDGIIGIVADFMDVPREVETAVGAVLNEKLQYVIVKDRHNGIEAIDYLKKKSAGRGTFLPAGPDSKTAGSPLSAASWKGDGTPLASMVSIKKGYEGLLDILLGNVLLVGTINEGLKQRDAGFNGVTVTPDGDVIDSNGAITGGQGEGAGFDLLKREREIKELSGVLTKKKKELENITKNRLNLLEDMDNAEKELDDLKRREFAKDIEITNLEKDKSSAGEEVRRETERLKIITMEEDQLKSEIEEFNNEKISSEEKLSTFGNEEVAKEEEIKSGQEGFAKLGEELEKVRQELTELRVIGRSFSERREGLERELASVGNAREETLRLLERDERTLSEGKEKAKGLYAELAETKEALGRLLGEHTELKKNLDGKKNVYNELAEEIRGVEKELKEFHRSFDDISRRTSQLKVLVAEREMEIKHLAEGILEKYDIELASELGNIPLPVDGDEDKLKALNSRIEELGEVNLTALSEHKENLERMIFLEEQEKDLLEAIESLKRTISKINVTSRQRFKETFEAVNGKFTNLFPKLFRGGKAKLVLTDEDDLLETGVDIVAQPPGKKLQTINLLSGGEKALTAITLIFSMFLVKPSPFCLLDEVDAPLDDTNVGRFNELVKEMSKVSQIIMITHNKSSIEIGDTLYGVTMEDPGVSKFVSVQLN